MHRTEFRSDSPLDDLPRVLDIARKLNYGLRAVAMTADDDGPARISISFVPNGMLSVETFIALVRRLPGVVDVRHIAPAPAEPTRQDDSIIRESVFA